ncbi:MAG: histidine--tRNA ligase [Bernardetiaceae bacterium]|nr:histidine--tRNA ligase [Bernardetiaceae bacterium]
MSKPSIPQGTRDFTPEVVAKRTYIFDTIRRAFARYGFQPIETPSLENLSTLTGKYGEEGDQLLFRILNSGDFLSKATEREDYRKMAPQISEKGLRYDLTVPFARYVAMHQNEIAFPFKRYQIQPVWRADRPQKGRYREFYQCDADVVGSYSLVCEAELLQLVDEVFSELKIPVTIKLNNRKVLQGLAEKVGQADQLTAITTAIDKLDKIGWEKVRAELLARGIPETAAEQVGEFLQMSLADLGTFLAGTPSGPTGLAEIAQILDLLQATPLRNAVEVDVTLARGLNYYTGAIIEVKAQGVAMGSISGGGRYDDLTSGFGLPGVPGVGISFGADRIYDVLEALGGFPDTRTFGTQLLFVAMDPAGLRYALPLLRQVRQAGCNAELYPEPAKLKKQLGYADKKQIPWVAIIGPDEMANGLLALKNLATGQQQSTDLPGLLALLKN